MQFYKFEGISTAERRPGENDSRRIMCEKHEKSQQKQTLSICFGCPRRICL